MTKYWDEAYQRAKRSVGNVLRVDGGSLPKYKVLQVDMMKEVDKEKAMTVASFVSSGEEAYKLAGHDGFSYQDLDTRRRVGVVRYSPTGRGDGFEVAVLFRRLVIEREPLPEEPVPERVLMGPADEWLVIPLINSDKVAETKGFNSSLRTSLADAQRYRTLYHNSERQRLEAEQELVKFRNQTQELLSLKEKVGLQGKQLQATEQDLERSRLELKKEQQLRREDKVTMVRQLMPAFTTAWLAGLHRVGDQLYGMLKKQIIEGLQGIGVEMVAPDEGVEFDPSLHHAIHSYEYPAGDRMIGKVVSVSQIGWRLSKGVVLEPAMVSVGVESKEEKNDERGHTSGTEEGTVPENGSTGNTAGDSGSGTDVGHPTKVQGAS